MKKITNLLINNKMFIFYNRPTVKMKIFVNQTDMTIYPNIYTGRA